MDYPEPGPVRYYAEGEEYRHPLSGALYRRINGDWVLVSLSAPEPTP